MKKTILIILALLAIVAICVDRLGFSDEVKVGNLYWMTRNVGGNPKDIEGDKYTFHQAQSICPEGWRLPTKSEFEALIRNYSQNTEYKKLKGRWFCGGEYYSQSVPAVFLPQTYINSKFNFGSYWTSTPYDKTQAYALTFNARYVSINLIHNTQLLSVRCVK